MNVLIIGSGGREHALAWADISTGALHVLPLPPARIGPELARLMPSEVLLADGVDGDIANLVTDMGASVTPLGRSAFDSTGAAKRLCVLFEVQTLDAFGTFERAEVAAMGVRRQKRGVDGADRRPGKDLKGRWIVRAQLEHFGHAQEHADLVCAAGASP